MRGGRASSRGAPAGAGGGAEGRTNSCPKGEASPPGAQRQVRHPTRWRQLKSALRWGRQGGARTSCSAASASSAAGAPAGRPGESPQPHELVERFAISVRCVWSAAPLSPNRLAFSEPALQANRTPPWCNQGSGVPRAAPGWDQLDLAGAAGPGCGEVVQREQLDAALHQQRVLPGGRGVSVALPQGGGGALPLTCCVAVAVAAARPMMGVERWVSTPSRSGRAGQGGTGRAPGHTTVPR